MKKKEILTDSYYTQIILYIHFNAVKHGFVINPLEWPYSSIHYYLNNSSIRLQIGSEILKNGINEVIDWFEGIDQFKEMHTLYDPYRELRFNDFEI